MKRYTLYTFPALALLLAAAACTQDDAGFLPEGAEGTPIVFTATGLNPAATATAGTRAPVDGNWEGVLACLDPQDPRALDLHALVQRYLHRNNTKHLSRVMRAS